MTQTQKILCVIIGNIVIVIAELLFGVISNSYALVADALHNAGDILAVFITYIALKLGTKSPTFKQTFGYIRAEMMAAFVNSLFLCITMLLVIYEAITKLITPEIINPFYMMTVGGIAIIANGLSAYILLNLGVAHEHEHEHEHDEKHKSDKDANVASAYLHMLGDALISIAVVVAGIFIYLFEIYSIDSILTLCFSAYILSHTYPLLKTSFMSLMDMNVTHIKKDTLEAIILNQKHIIKYHDLHIYKPNSNKSYISLHIMLDDTHLTLDQIETITNQLREQLKKLGFTHILIQVESQNIGLHCDPCTYS